MEFQKNARTRMIRTVHSSCTECADLQYTPTFVHALMAVGKLGRVRAITRYHNNDHRIGTIHV